jgi:hypothetical protein
MRIFALSLFESVLTLTVTLFLIKKNPETSADYYIIALLYIFMAVIKMFFDCIIIASPKSMKNLFQYLLMLLLINILEIGLLFVVYFLINVKSNHAFVVTGLIGILISFASVTLVSRTTKQIRKINAAVTVLLCFNNKIIQVDSLIDSGNMLKNPADNKSVVILSTELRKTVMQLFIERGKSDEKIDDKNNLNFNPIQISCSTIAGSKILYGCYADSLSAEICGKKYFYEEVPVVFSNERLFENKIQGIVSAELFGLTFDLSNMS